LPAKAWNDGESRGDRTRSLLQSTLDLDP
jgi:hypothetical protein